MECRPGCGACCIAPSISSPIPGPTDPLATGPVRRAPDAVPKPAGVRCVQLTEDNRCKLFGRPDRPAVCIQLRPDPEMCGSSREEALAYLTALDAATRR